MSKADNTRRHIIEMAAPIFNVKGIAATSIAGVTKAADVARGCLYGHFESKDDLAYACVDYLLQAVSEVRDAAMAKQSTAFGKILTFLDISKDPLSAQIVGGCPLMNLSTEVDDTNPAIKKKVRLSIDQHIRLFTDILQEGIETGEFAEQLDPETFAVNMLCSVKGAVVLGSVKHGSGIIRTVTESIKTDLARYLKSGIPVDAAIAIN